MIKEKINFILKNLKFSIKDLSNLLNIKSFKIYKYRRDDTYNEKDLDINKIEEIYKIAIFFQKNNIIGKNYLLTEKLDEFCYSIIDCINNNINYKEILVWIKKNHKKFVKLPYNYKDIELKIQEVRKLLKLPLLYLAKIIGISHQAISLWKLNNKLPNSNNLSITRLFNLFKLTNFLKENKFNFFYNFLLKEKLFNNNSIYDLINKNKNYIENLNFILNISKEINLFKNNFKNIQDLKENITLLKNKYNINNENFEKNLFLKIFLDKYNLKKIILNIKQYLNLSIKEISQILNISPNQVYFIQKNKNLTFDIIKKINLLNDLSDFYKKNKIKNKDYLIKENLFDNSSIIEQISKLENYENNINKLKNNYLIYPEKFNNSQIYLKNVLNLKENLNLTVKDLAKLLEITFCSIYKWKDKNCIPEPNDKKLKNVENLNKILNLFNKYNISFTNHKKYFYNSLQENKNFLQLYNYINFKDLYKLFENYIINDLNG